MKKKYIIICSIAVCVSITAIFVLKHISDNRIKNVELLISNIDISYSDTVTKANQAIDAYEKLYNFEKKKVKNFSELKKIQATFKKIKAVNVEIGRLDIISETLSTHDTYDFAKKVTEVKKAYNNLSEIEKSHVSNSYLLPSLELKIINMYCNTADCKNLKMEGSSHLYCFEHTCQVESCDAQKVKDYDFCPSHICYFVGCDKASNSMNIYCNDHISISE